MWGPFNGSTCLSYQYNSSSTLSSGILNETAFADWTPSLTGGIPAVSGTTCSADNCTVKATNLTATTAYFVALMNKQPQAASVYAIYAQGEHFLTCLLADSPSLTRLLIAHMACTRVRCVWCSVHPCRCLPFWTVGSPCRCFFLLFCASCFCVLSGNALCL